MEVTEKLKLLEENVKLLQEIETQTTVEDLRKNRRLEWEVRYGLFESIQIVIDIACKLSSEYNLGNPKTYRACIELLSRYEYLDETIAKKVIGMIGLRNLLVHEYVKIDAERLYRFLERLEDFIDFVKAIKAYI